MSLTVTGLCLYPIKSCGGLEVGKLQIGVAGPELKTESQIIIGDRQWMFVDSEGGFLTQRKFPQMSLFKPVIQSGHLHLQVGTQSFPVVPAATAGSQEQAPVQVWGKHLSAELASAEISKAASEFLKLEVRLVEYSPQSPRESLVKGKGLGVQTRFTDSQQFLVISEESLADLNSRLKDPVPRDRFRANIWVKGAGPYREDQWGGLKSNEAEFEFTKGCARCKVITVDQEKGEILDSEPLKVLSQYRRRETQVYFGQYFLSRSVGGVLRVGDLLVDQRMG